MNYAGISFEQVFDFPFPGFVDTPFGAAYERALAKVVGVADDINGKLDNERLRVAIAHDRSAALHGIAEEYCCRLMGTINVTLGVEIKIHFWGIRNETRAFASLVGRSPEEVVAEAKETIALLIGSAGDTQEKDADRQGHLFYWLQKVAEACWIAERTALPKAGEHSLQEVVFDAMARDNSFEQVILDTSRMFYPYLMSNTPGRLQGLLTVKPSEIIFPLPVTAEPTAGMMP